MPDKSMYIYTSAMGKRDINITKIKNFRMKPVSKKRISALISNMKERYHKGRESATFLINSTFKLSAVSFNEFKLSAH